MPTSLSVFLATWKGLNQSIKAKLARLITSSMTLLLVVTLQYQQIVSPQPQTASHGCKVFISKSAFILPDHFATMREQIKGLSRSRGAPIMSGGRRYSGRSRCGSIIPHCANPKNEKLKLRKRSSRSYMPIDFFFG